MELENRVGNDTSAKANILPMKTSVCTSHSQRGRASSDVHVQGFANQQHHDMHFHAYAKKQHLPCADVLVPVSATQHQPVCPITPHTQVMTDEQLETLRRQISVYATICQQLVEMHKAIMAQQSSTSGLWLGPSIPLDSLHSIGHKLASRQRWTPSQTQVHMLERLFEEESGTPNKQRIKEITVELSQHGQISETNVYNWFQNRRARTKRRQQLGGLNNGDSELDTDVDLPEEKKSKTEGDFTHESLDATRTTRAVDNVECYQGLSEFSQRHAHPNSPAASFNKSTFNGHGEMQASRFADCNLRDLPLTLPESKADFSAFSVSQEFQGQQIIVTGAEGHC